MKLNDTLHKALIAAGAILAVMGFVVSYVIGEPLILMPTALAVAAAGYGYVKLYQDGSEPEAENEERIGAVA